MTRIQLLCVFLFSLRLEIAVEAIATADGSTSCDVFDYGAKGTGIDYDTEAIQMAIDSCAKSANGNPFTVVFSSPGRFLTGTIFLRTNMLLQILPGATLLASSLEKHYSEPWYLVLAQNVSNVGISGGGSIDGQSSKFVLEFSDVKNVMMSWNTSGVCTGDECRPRLVGFLDSMNIHVWNVHLQQPAYWCMHIVRSDNVSIHDVSIVGDPYTPNNDGIDIDSSNNTVIHNCQINTGDDAICPKTTYGPVYNVTVFNCWIKTKSCAIKLGSASSFNFHHLRFQDIQIVDSNRGLGIQLRDSGNVSDVVFSNIDISTRYYHPSWWGLAEPIYVTACPRTAATTVGFVHDVRFKHISAKSENGIFLSGIDGGLLGSLELQNVQVYLKRITNYTGGLLDYRPGCVGLLEHQNAAIFIQNVSTVSLDNVHITVAQNIISSISPMEVTSAKHSFSFSNFSLNFISYPSDGIKWVQ